MGDLSPHFSRHEFDSHDGAIAHPDPNLIDRLEKLRHIVGDVPLKSSAAIGVQHGTPTSAERSAASTSTTARPTSHTGTPRWSRH